MDLRNVSFEALYEKVARMGAPIVDFTIQLDMPPVDSIDRKLTEGLVTPLDNVEYKHGLPTYEGRQVLIYIQDHGGRVGKALQDGSLGNKYHVGYCQTLERMQNHDRFQRYVMANDLTPNFFISGRDWGTDEEMEGDTRLKVCKNCLQKLNYQGYTDKRIRNKVFSAFDLEKFFSTYSSFFPHPPSRFAGPASRESYTDDWSTISKKYRTSLNFICEGCELDLSEHSRLLHTHHKSGVKTDNRPTNLMALCVACHSAQPCHGHMFVSHKDRQTITRLRRQQGKLEANNWNGVIKMVDPGVKGLAFMCQQLRLPIPEIGHEIRDDNDNVVSVLELAWPDRKVGIAIDAAKVIESKPEDWKIWEVMDTLDDFKTFHRLL